MMSMRYCKKQNEEANDRDKCHTNGENQMEEERGSKKDSIE